MRTPIYVLIAALFFSGCTHYHAAPPGPAARVVDRVSEPKPDPVEPLELEIGRPSGGQLLLQTNRPAYVAIFEIIPNRGVTLIYPAAVHQQNMLVSGLTWVPLWWSPKRVSLNSDRYIYAVASEEPLDFSDETFVGGYFHRVLGPGIYRAERPYSTMRAISRAVVPNVAEEQWAEDVYVLTPTYFTEPYRTARIYCPGGRVFDVPEDMLARIWCPTRTRVVIIDASRPRSRDYPVARPVRPDSVFGHGGRQVRVEPRRRGPIVRVVDPTGRDRDDRDVRRGRDDRDDRDDRGRGRDVRRDDRDDRDSDEDSEKPEKEKEPRGRIKDLIDAKKQEQEREKQERERQRREAEDARRREAEERKAERDERQDERRDERDARKDERDERKDERKDERDARKDEREERKDERKDEPKQQGQPREEKAEEKRDEKREESRDDNKRRGSIKDMIKDAKEKEKKEKP